MARLVGGFVSVQCCASLAIADAGTKLHANAARPLLRMGLIRRGAHRDFLTPQGREILRLYRGGR